MQCRFSIPDSSRCAKLALPGCSSCKDHASLEEIIQALIHIDAKYVVLKTDAQRVLYLWRCSTMEEMTRAMERLQQDIE